MTGLPLIFAFVLAIIVMIVAISKFRIHPFLAILAVSVIFGLVGGIPLVKHGKTLGIADVVSAGFAGTFTSIGIVIIMGALIGTLLEKTGAALKMADCVVRLVGKNNTSLAVLIMGWIVSIPVFCDSGFVILNPIRKALVRRTHCSAVATAVAMSMGLYISHCFIPPTPGPIAAANTIYEGMGMEPNLILIIGLGTASSILPMIAAYIYANYIGTKVKSKEERAQAAEPAETQQTYEELIKSYGKLPSAFASFAPIVVPIILMGLSSAMAMAGTQSDIIKFLGTPIIAISVGVILGIIVLMQSSVEDKMKAFYQITDDTLKVVGPILFITAAGGVLGKVIASTSMVAFIKANSSTLASLGIFFPFLLSAILKTAQGSSTVAITTTAGIMAPLMGTLGLGTPMLAAITVIAIGAGAMTVSHANDSYFWVVTNFGDMEVQDGYKAQTLGTLVTGIAAMINVYILYLILG